MTTALGVQSSGVPASPAGVLITPDGHWVLAAMSTGVAVMKRQGNGLVFDHTVATSNTAFGLALSHDGTTVAAGLPGGIALLDLQKTLANDPAAVTATVPTAGKMGSVDVAFSKDDRFVFLALEYNNAVSVIDVKNKTEVGEIPIAGRAVTGLALSPDGGRLYVVCEVANEFQGPPPAVDQDVGKITVVDAAKATTNPTGAIVGQAFVGRGPVRITSTNDGAVLWVTLRGSNALIALDAQNLTAPGCNPVLATVAVGPSPVGLAAIENGTRIAVADSDRFTMTNPHPSVMFVGAADALAGGNNALIGQVTVGNFPREIAFDSTGLVVSNFKSQSLSATNLPP